MNMVMAILANIALGAAAASGGSSTPDSAKGGQGTGVGTITKGILLSQAILGVLKHSGRMLQEVSGQMKASFNLMKKSIQLILKPIGDVIGMILRPFAIGMMRFALPFYKKWLKSDVAKAIMTGEPTDNPATAAGVVGVKMGAGAVAGGTIGSWFGPIGIIIGAVAGAIAAVLTDAWQGLKNLWMLAGKWIEWIGWQLDNFFGMFGINMGAVRAAIAEFMLVTIPEWWNAAIEGIIAAWNWLVEFFSETVPGWVKMGWDGLVEFFSVTIPGWIKSGWNTLVEWLVMVPVFIQAGWNFLSEFFTKVVPAWFSVGWDIIKKFITETVPKWFTDGWSKIKEFIVTTIPGWFQSMIDAIKRAMSRATGGLIGGKAGGGPVYQTGQYMLHAGEFVMRAGQVQQMKDSNQTIQFNPQITINANVANGLDIRALANELARYQEVELRRRVSF
jgi:hypothetical protein